MKTGMKPVLFAGRQEYKQDLSVLRENVKPLSRQLQSERISHCASIQMASIENWKSNLRNREESGHKRPFDRLLLWCLKGGELDVQVLGMLLSKALLAGRNNPEKRASARAHKEKLVAAVKRLRGETDPARSTWLQEFERESGLLNRLERFTLTHWNWNDSP